jgi:hypothetical protein
LLAGGLLFVLDKSILETVACAFVANYFARKDFAEAGEDQVEVLI